jgi:hypothetical protein
MRHRATAWVTDKLISGKRCRVVLHSGAACLIRTSPDVAQYRLYVVVLIFVLFPIYPCRLAGHMMTRLRFNSMVSTIRIRIWSIYERPLDLFD